MMIYIDRREGSKDLAPLLRVPNIIVTLDFGDAMFGGNAESGPILIGIERKKLPDLLGSIASGRLVGHQIPGMMKAYEVNYLIVEGIWKGDRGSGELTISKDGGRTFRQASFGKRTWTEAGVYNFLTSIETHTSMHYRLTRDAKGTARMIEYLESWWGKRWESHRSQMALYGGTKVNYTPQQVSLMPNQPISYVRKFAAQLPNIAAKAIEVDKHFKSVAEMFAADVVEWQRVPGIGKVIANNVWRILHDK
jgi:ERCC4-type nuclease